jgi:hypothetical protein
MGNSLQSFKTTLLILLCIIMSTSVGFSQEHKEPISFEALVGDEAVFAQLVLNRNFSSTSKLSLFSLATYTADYNSEEDNDEYELNTINQISYDLGKGFGLMGGVNVNSEIGLSPVIGPKHVYGSRKFLAVSILSYSVNGEHDLSFFGTYEFTPALSKTTSLFTKLQVLLNHSLGENQHNRSFLYLRIGLKQDSLNFGLGANLDQYGPDKKYTDNYGAFVGWNF